MMTSLSENIAAIETAPTESTVVTPFKRRGRPLGVKNGHGVARKKKPVKNPRVRINVDAIVANGEVKKLTAEVSSLKVEVEKLRSAYIGAELHIEATEKKHKAALIVIGYLEGKIFQS
jgi:hypothetical protein